MSNIYFNISKEAAMCVRAACGKLIGQVKEEVCVEHHCIFVHDSNSMKKSLSSINKVNKLS